MDMTILADAGDVGQGIALAIVAPVIVALALVTWLRLTRRASSSKVIPEKLRDQDSHRGPEQGGYYRYAPGVYSHSYGPGKTKYKDMPQ